MGLGYTDPCPLGQAIAFHPKLYDAEVLSYQCVKPDVHDTEEILNDAEESQVKMKEKLFPFNYENINSLYDISEESDVPPKEMPNESKFQKLFEITEEVHEMLDIFESMERKVDRTSKKNEFLQNKIDQLLEANIANDVRNIVMQSYVEIKNKEEIERFLKDSKDGDKFCNDVVEVKEKLSKQIVQLVKYFAKREAQSIAFEIALQHKTQENKYLKTLQKENENFMASLQIENVHLKQTYKDLFETVQSSRVQTIQCDEVKIKFDFDKIETQNIDSELKTESREKKNLFENKTCILQTKINELEKVLAQQTKDFENAKIELFEKESWEKKNLFESKTCVFQIKIVELEKTLAKQTKENSNLLMKIDNLENAFTDEVKRLTTRKLTAFDKENRDFGSKVTHLEKFIAQKTKDFDDVKLELSNRRDKFKAYFEKLENTKVILERQLARNVDDSKAEKD
ncbi:hypothetical protein Tco_0370183 [Tanacetum coccineum]